MPIWNMFFSREQKCYYMTNNIYCEICKEMIQRGDHYTAFLIESNNNKHLFCVKCAKGVHPYQVNFLQSTGLRVQEDELPLDARRTYLRFPEMVYGNMSTMDIEKMPSNKVFDNTKYAGRPEGSWETSKIGSQITDDDKNRKINTLSDSEALMEAILDAKPLKGGLEEIRAKKEANRELIKR